MNTRSKSETFISLVILLASAAACSAGTNRGGIDDGFDGEPSAGGNNIDEPSIDTNDASTDEQDDAEDGLNPECSEFEILHHGDLDANGAGLVLESCQEHRWWVPSVYDGSELEIIGGVGGELEAELVRPAADEFGSCNASIDEDRGAGHLVLSGVHAGELELRVRNLGDSPDDITVSRRCDGSCVSAFPRYPVLLVPGWGNNSESLIGWDYFDGTKDWAQDELAFIDIADLPPFKQPEQRARDLEDELNRVRESFCARKVNLVAHSQGGLDSRVLISGLGHHDDVSALITFGTPHHGSPLAEFFDAPEFFLSVLELFGLGALVDWLKTIDVMDAESAEQLADDFPDVSSVDYMSYAGRADLCLDLWGKVPSGIFPNEDNDCMVSVEDAKHGDVLNDIYDLPELDHWAQIGHDSCPFEFDQFPSDWVEEHFEACTAAGDERHHELYSAFLGILAERGH